jgi:3-keto-5-aminohexanoate cleavage enzyme
MNPIERRSAPRLIITVAPTGSVPTKQQNPHLPITPDEIAETARHCRDAGASIIHVHARDQHGQPTLDPDVFAAIVSAIHARCPDLIIQISTGGRAGSDPQRRVAAVQRLKPEMASLTTGSVNFSDRVYENANETIEFLARAQREAGTKPEMEIFDTGMIETAVALADKGLANRPLHFDFVLGLPGGTQPATPKQLFHLVESIPSDSTWTVAGIGRHQLTMGALGIVLGGHVRVGLEDNMYYAKGVLASNEMLVERIVRIATELGREIASPDEARVILGLR